MINILIILSVVSLQISSRRELDNTRDEVCGKWREAISESLGTSIGAEWEGEIRVDLVHSVGSMRGPVGCPLVRLGYCKSRTKTPMAFFSVEGPRTTVPIGCKQL